MNTLEDDLRLALRRHALDANGAAVPTWDPPARRPWHSRPWFLPTMAAAAALVFVAGAGIAVSALTSEPTSAPGPGPIALSTIVIDPSPSASASPTEDGGGVSSGTVAGSVPGSTSKSQKSSASTATSSNPEDEAFTFRGVAIYPPEGFVRATATCDPDARKIVVVGDPSDVCVPRKSSGTAVVWLLAAESEKGAELTPWLNRPILRGHSTQYAAGECPECSGEGPGDSAIYFREQRVVVLVIGSESLTESVLGGAHVPDKG